MGLDSWDSLVKGIGILRNPKSPGPKTSIYHKLKSPTFLKTNSSPLKIDYFLKRSFPFGFRPIFRGELLVSGSVYQVRRCFALTLAGCDFDFCGDCHAISGRGSRVQTLRPHAGILILDFWT